MRKTGDVPLLDYGMAARMRCDGTGCAMDGAGDHTGWWHWTAVT